MLYSFREVSDQWLARSIQSLELMTAVELATFQDTCTRGMWIPCWQARDADFQPHFWPLCRRDLRWGYSRFIAQIRTCRWWTDR